GLIQRPGPPRVRAGPVRAGPEDPPRRRAAGPGPPADAGGPRAVPDDGPRPDRGRREGPGRRPARRPDRGPPRLAYPGEGRRRLPRGVRRAADAGCRGRRRAPRARALGPLAGRPPRLPPALPPRARPRRRCRRAGASPRPDRGAADRDGPWPPA